MKNFYESMPTNESYWRSIILFGANAASYKFALAKTLLDLSKENKTRLNLEDLALPYAKYICKHIEYADRQGTSPTSRFLDACRDYNNNIITEDKLKEITISIGFENVIDAFHNVNRESIDNKFYVKKDKSYRKGIILTDNIFLLNETKDGKNLKDEIESRWNLVETAWNVNLPTNTIKIDYNQQDKSFFLDQNNIMRSDITPARPALNGYQKGRCFYCFDKININIDDLNCDVDHFFPFSLQEYFRTNLDGVWNLVLACKDCNRGVDGKFASIPNLKYLERLNRRNNFLVESHHPLRQTIMNQTGRTRKQRIDFLQNIDNQAISLAIHRWSTDEKYEAIF